MIQNLIPDSWTEGLVQNVPASVFEQLNTFLNKEYQEHTVYPTKAKIFSALDGLTPEDIKVVILGQDPYHEAHHPMAERCGSAGVRCRRHTADPR